MKRGVLRNYVGYPFVSLNLFYVDFFEEFILIFSILIMLNLFVLIIDGGNDAIKPRM